MGYQEKLATMRDELKKSDDSESAPEQAPAEISAEAAATILKDAASPEARDLVAKISGAGVRLAQVAGLLNIPPDTPTEDLRWKVGSAVGLLEQQVRLEQILGPSEAFKAAVAAADVEKGAGSSEEGQGSSPPEKPADAPVEIWPYDMATSARGKDLVL